MATKTETIAPEINTSDVNLLLSKTQITKMVITEIRKDFIFIFPLFSFACKIRIEVKHKRIKCIKPHQLFRINRIIYLDI